METTAEVVGCPGCGTRALSGADCDVATWTERTEAIAPVAVMKLVGATNWFIRVRFLDV